MGGRVPSALQGRMLTLGVTVGQPPSHCATTGMLTSSHSYGGGTTFSVTVYVPGGKSKVSVRVYWVAPVPAELSIGNGGLTAPVGSGGLKAHWNCCVTPLG